MAATNVVESRGIATWTEFIGDVPGGKTIGTRIIPVSHNQSTFSASTSRENSGNRDAAGESIARTAGTDGCHQAAIDPGAGVDRGGWQGAFPAPGRPVVTWQRLFPAPGRPAVTGQRIRPGPGNLPGSCQRSLPAPETSVAGSFDRSRQQAQGKSEATGISRPGNEAEVKRSPLAARMTSRYSPEVRSSSKTVTAWPRGSTSQYSGTPAFS
jgi:hypothetical protein